MTVVQASLLGALAGLSVVQLGVLITVLRRLKAVLPEVVATATFTISDFGSPDGECSTTRESMTPFTPEQEARLREIVREELRQQQGAQRRWDSQRARYVVLRRLGAQSDVTRSSSQSPEQGCE